MIYIGKVQEQEKPAIENGANGQTNGQQTSLDDCEMEVGAVILRGNRILLAQCPGKKELKGLQIPFLPLDEEEMPEECAIRVIENDKQLADAVRFARYIPNGMVYRPNGRQTIQTLLVLEYLEDVDEDFEEDCKFFIASLPLLLPMTKLLNE